MNALRRTFLILYSLLMLAAAGGLIALAWNQDRKLDLNAGDFNIQGFISASDGAKWIATGALAAIAVIAFISLIVAVMRDTSVRRGSLRMRQADGGTVEVTGSAIENLLQGELERLPDVRKAEPRVRLASGGAVETTLDATIEPSANIAQVTNELAQTVAMTLRDQVGVTNVRRPTIRISYDEVLVRQAPKAPRHEPMRQIPVAGAPQFDSPARAPEGFRDEDARPND